MTLSQATTGLRDQYSMVYQMFLAYVPDCCADLGLDPLDDASLDIVIKRVEHLARTKGVIGNDSRWFSSNEISWKLQQSRACLQFLHDCLLVLGNSHVFNIVVRPAPQQRSILFWSRCNI